MSLADDWDAIPTSNQSDQPKSLADDWDATPTTVAKTPIAKAQGTLSDINAIGEGIRETGLNALTGMAGTIAGGWRGLMTLAKGGSVDDAANAIKQTEQALTYQPKTAAGNLGQLAMQSPKNPMNAFSVAGNYVGEKVGQVSPAAGAALNAGINVIPFVAGGLATRNATPTISATGEVSDVASARAPWEGEAPKAVPITSLPGSVGSAATGEAVPIASFDNSDLAKPGPKSAAQIADKQAVLSRIGLDQTHKAFVEGNPSMAGALGQAQRVNLPAGEQIRGLLEDNRTALQNHAQNIVESTGGTFGTDESSLNNSGQIIAAPFDKANKFFDDSIKNLYSEADKRAAGAPAVNLDSFNKMMTTDSQFAGKAPNQSLGNGIKSYLKEQGIMDSDGNMQPVTVKQAEQVKQYINSQWDYQTSGLAGKIKGAIDDDVLKGAGNDIYGQARQLYQLKKQTLDNPNGIAKIMEADPQTPINRKTPFEKIPDVISRMPVQQFSNVIDTLKSFPDEIQPDAQAAIGEIKANLANKLYDIGNKTQEQWNAPGVTAYLNKNIEKFNTVFSPAEMAKIKDLQRGGNILRYDSRYPGAEVQKLNLLKEGIGPHLINMAGGPIGAAAGSLIGMPGIGAAGGALGASKIASGMANKAAVGKVTNAMVNLKSVNKP